jgi:hypothetical protein
MTISFQLYSIFVQFYYSALVTTITFYVYGYVNYLCDYVLCS